VDQSIIDQITAEARSVIGTARQIAPFSSRYSGFTLADAYRVALRQHETRAAQGERAIGRKIGFTNRAIWASYGIAGPIWGYVYDTTVKDLTDGVGRFSLAGLAEARIEPEIVLHLAAAPKPDMDEDELLACVDWVSHGFEIVQSIFPGWVFEAADAVAARAVHVALLLGNRHAITEDPLRWKETLRTFSIEMTEANGTKRVGHGRDVLGGPIQALRFLVMELERYPGGQPLAAGEIVTTGTLTEAMPIKNGQSWATGFHGIAIEGLRLRFE
jgi:2-oxo-3-hexenedioate decarboxylase